MNSIWSVHPVKNNSINTDEILGEFRIKLFLEDLGPIELFKQSEQKIEEEIIKKGLIGIKIN